VAAPYPSVFGPQALPLRMTYFDAGQKSLRETAEPSSSSPLAWLAVDRLY
jgi:hypothetical protein